MTWADVRQPPTSRVLRQFAAVLVILGGWLVFVAKGPDAARIAGLVLLVTGVAGVAWPRLVRWVFTGAMVVAFPIGFIVSALVLVIMFFGVFLPVGAGLRARGWDPMVRRRRADASSYWSPKRAPSDLRRYLRQY